MHIHSLFDPATFTLTYVVFDSATRDAVIIDPVLDFDPVAVQTSLASLESVSAFLVDNRLNLHSVLETHAHADHLTGAQYLKHRFGAGVVIGRRITEVQAVFRPLFDLPTSFPTDGRQFDRLLSDGERLQAGSLLVEALETPGHTPACLTYKIGDALFTGDALFIEDYGTGRCDFPRGSAEELYDSIHRKLYGMPDDTRVFVGHDYQPGDRALRYETTIGASKQHNIQLRAQTSKEEFVSMRNSRDKTLAAPKLLFPSVQININAGQLPPPRTNGVRYLHTPLNLRKPTADDGTEPLTVQG